MAAEFKQGVELFLADNPAMSVVQESRGYFLESVLNEENDDIMRADLIEVLTKKTHILENALHSLSELGVRLVADRNAHRQHYLIPHGPIDL